MHRPGPAEEQVRFQLRLLAAVGQAIIAMDPAGRVIHWNAAAEATYGWTADEAIGQPVHSLLPPAAGWEQRAAEVPSEVVAGRAWSGELWFRAKDGSTVPVMVVDTPVHDDDEAFVATIAVSWDISERLRSEESTALLSSIVESSNDAIFSETIDGRITTWNDAATHLLGYEPDEVIGGSVGRLIPAGWSTESDSLRDLVRRGEVVKDLETVLRAADGHYVHVSLSLSPMRDRSGVVIGASTIARDITERVELRRRIVEDRRRLAAAQASAHLGSFEVDLESGEVTRSDELYRILGREPGSLTGVDFDHIHPDDRDEVRAALDSAMAGPAHVEVTHRIVRPDGEVRWVVSSTSNNGTERAKILAGTMLDVTERHEAERALAHQATHDPLTGLPNRSNVTEVLWAHLRETSAPRRGVAVALLDLDQFKVINDSLGHHVGDLALQAVAGRLRDGLPDTDLVGRFSGDEFVLVRPGVEGFADAAALAADALRLLEAPVLAGERHFRLTASVGVTVATAADTPETLLRDADVAMYQAKDDGRARATVFDETARARAQRRSAVEAALAVAIERDELRLAFQPVLELATGTVAGFEALVRWDHPDLGPVPPSEFIPIAEKSGLITLIGDWVLDHALGQLSAWHDQPGVRPDLWMAVNLSAPQLADPGLADRLAGAIRAADLAPALVHLEITETVLMDRIENAAATVEALRALGIRISIDDFGTGYSSLSYLNRLPIDVLKIDQSFVQGLGPGGHDTSIVRAILTLATAMGLEVVAEGVEDRDQLELLEDLGCPLAQGFLWAPALPAATAFAWMRERDDVGGSDA